MNGSSTIRNKAERKDPGHEGDKGIKPASALTVYVDTNPSILSTAGLSGIGSRGSRVVIKDGKATLVTWNDKAGKWGATLEGRDVPIHMEPAVGRYPLELWQPASDFSDAQSFSKMHAGNKIVSMSGGRKAAPSSQITNPATLIQTPDYAGMTPAEIAQMPRDGKSRQLMIDAISAQNKAKQAELDGDDVLAAVMRAQSDRLFEASRQAEKNAPIPPAPDRGQTRYAGMTPTQIPEKSGRRVPMQGTRQGPIDPALPIRDMTDLVRIARDGVRSDMAMAERKRLRDQIIGQGEKLSPDVRRDLMRTVRESLAGDMELAARIENEANTLFQATPQGPAQEPAPVAKKPVSLIQFLATKGGLKPDPELRALDIYRKNVSMKGLVNTRVKEKGPDGQETTVIRSRIGAKSSRFVNRDGINLDAAREAAAQEGYLPMDSTIDDFLQLIDKDFRDGDVFREQDMDASIDWRSRVEQDRRGPDYQPRKKQVDPNNPYGLTDENIDEFDATYRRVLDLGFSQEVADRVLSMMSESGGFGRGMVFDLALDTAIEIDTREQYDRVDPGHEDIPFWEEISKDSADGENTRKSSETGRDGGTQSAEPAGRPEGRPVASRQEPTADGQVQAGRGNEDGGSSNRESAAVSRPEAVSSTKLITDARTASAPIVDPVDLAMMGAEDVEAAQDALDAASMAVRAANKAIAKKYGVSSRQIDSLEDVASEEDYDFLYMDESVLDLSDYEKYARVIEPVGSLGAATQEMAYALRDLSDQPIDDLRNWQKIPIARLMFLASEVNRLGGDQKAALKKAMENYGNRFDDPNDRDFMLRSLADTLKPIMGQQNNAPALPAPRTEAGADGKPQMVIPGAERAPDRDMAQRKADAPLKPKVQQKDAGGLFSDDANQMDLVDLSRQKPKDDVEYQANADNSTAEALLEIDTSDDYFIYPVSESKKLETILSEVAPDYEFKGPFYISKDDKNRGVVRKFYLKARKSGQDVFIFERDNPGDKSEVWIVECSPFHRTVG